MATFYPYNPWLVLLSHVFFIGLTFYALQSVRYEQFIRKNKVFQAQLLFVLISMAIGYTLSTFFLDLSIWSNTLLSTISYID